MVRWVGVVLVFAGCGPSAGSSSGGASAEGGSEGGEDGVSQSGSDSGDIADTADTGGTADTDDDPPAADCDVVPATIELGEIHRAGASPSGCLFGHQVTGSDDGDSLRVAWLSTGEVEVISDALTRKLPYSWSFVEGDAIVFREVNDLAGPLRRWDSETSEIATMSDSAGDFLVTPDGGAVFWADAATDPSVLQVWWATSGAVDVLAEIEQLDDVYALSDGTQGALFRAPNGDLAWADSTGVNVLGSDITLGGVDAVGGRAMVLDNGDSVRMVALRGDAPDLPLDIVPPEEPGDITPQAIFSPDGTRMLVSWDVFDFDFGYTADRTDLVTFDGDAFTTQLSACPGWALPSVHDAGVLCWPELAGTTNAIEFLPYAGGKAEPLVEFGDWARREDGTTIVGTVVRGAPIDGADPEIVQLVDVSEATPTVLQLGMGFGGDFAKKHPRATSKWAIYGERPWLGFDETTFDPVWRAYNVDSGEALELPGVPVGSLPKYIVGSTVAYAGPDHDIITLGPRAP